MEMPHLKDLSLPAYVSLFPYVGQVHLGSYTLKGHIWLVRISSAYQSAWVYSVFLMEWGALQSLTSL